MTLDRSPLGLATLYADVSRELIRPGSRTGALDTIVTVALDRVAGVCWASITEGSNGRFSTVAATDERARAADEIQYELGSGPCVDAILQDTTFRTGNLGRDGRWPEFARQAGYALGVRSMLSIRFCLENDPRVSGLNLYSTDADAFDDDAQIIGTLVATHGALAITAATARDEATQLQVALANSREIGMAMGVLMATYKLTREQAFDLLRAVSQNSNRKLSDIAAEVADTGALNLPHDRVGKMIGGQPGPAPADS